MKFISQQSAQQIDIDLMSIGKFKLEQLMELAGLSVAEAVHTAFKSSPKKRLLMAVGPGNNGGDALVGIY